VHIIEIRTIDYELKQQYVVQLPFTIMAEYGDLILVSTMDNMESASVVVTEEGPYKITEDGIDLHFH
jgi:hypothetical protein